MKAEAHILLCNGLLKKWREAKPDSQELKDFTDNFIELYFYINHLEMEKYGVDKALSEYHSDKLRAVERARKSEEQNEKLRKQINKLKTLTNYEL